MICPVVVVSVSTMRDSLLSINSLIIIKLRWTRWSFLCLKATLTQNKSSIILTVQGDDGRTFIRENHVETGGLYLSSVSSRPLSGLVSLLGCSSSASAPPSQLISRSFNSNSPPPPPERDCFVIPTTYIEQYTQLLQFIKYHSDVTTQFPAKSSLIFHQIQNDMRKVW